MRHEKNRGVSAARNTGLLAASGDYVWFVDPDDYITEDAVFDLLHGLQDERPDVICFSTLCFGDVGTGEHSYVSAYKGKNVAEMLSEIYSGDQKKEEQVWRYLFKKEFLLQNKIYFSEGVSCWEDRDFLLKLLAVPEASVRSSQYLCYFYRRARTGSAVNKKIDTLSSMRLCENYLEKFKATQGTIKDIYAGAIFRTVNATIALIANGASLNKKESAALLKKHHAEYGGIVFRCGQGLSSFVGRVLRRSYFCAVLLRKIRANFVVSALVNIFSLGTRKIRIRIAYRRRLKNKNAV